MERFYLTETDLNAIWCLDIRPEMVEFPYNSISPWLFWYFFGNTSCDIYIILRNMYNFVSKRDGLFAKCVEFRQYLLSIGNPKISIYTSHLQISDNKGIALFYRIREVTTGAIFITFNKIADDKEKVLDALKFFCNNECRDRGIGIFFRFNYYIDLFLIF